MGSMLDAFPIEELLLHKSDGNVVQITALVDGCEIHSDNVEKNIEEDDIFERTLPNGAKEYYKVIDRDFYKGNHGIPDNYQSVVKKYLPVQQKWK